MFTVYFGAVEVKRFTAARIVLWITMMPTPTITRQRRTPLTVVFLKQPIPSGMESPSQGFESTGVMDHEA
jgi:hypothetical protein